MPIIVGAPRSGTTLLRFMLDAHPEIAIPPETGFLRPLSTMVGRSNIKTEELIAAIADAPTWPDFQLTKDAFCERLGPVTNPADAARWFYRLYAERSGKRRWGDKTPRYGPHIGAIQTLLPEAHFIHLIRDGRDVALSLRGLWFSPGDDIATLAAYWRDIVRQTREQARQCAHYLELRYEDLVQDPEHNLIQVAHFIGADFHPDMVRYFERVPLRLKEHGDHRARDGSLLVTKAARQMQQARTTMPPDRSRIFAWRHAMSAAERETFERMAGNLLRHLGYE